MITSNTCIYIYIMGCVCAVGILSVSGYVYEVCKLWACYGQLRNAYVYVWSVSVLSMLRVGCVYRCIVWGVYIVGRLWSGCL